VDDSNVLLSFPLCNIDTSIKNLEQDLHRVAICEKLMSKLPTDISVSFFGKSLKPVDSAKDLPVKLDKHLNYNHHISELVSSCMNKLCQINVLKPGLIQKL
jgi:hypothetical protein